MVRDGTNRGGRRVRAGARPEALNEKLTSVRPATCLTTPVELDVFDLDGTDIGVGAVLSGEPMPEPGDYLSAEQRDGKPLGAISSTRKRGSGSMLAAVPSSSPNA